MEQTIDTLKQQLNTISDLGAAASVLGWDQLTYMPPGGVGGRANQLATLHRLAHEYSTSDELGALLHDLSPLADSAPDTDDGALVRITQRDYEQARKLPAEFVSDWTKARALAHQAWEDARRDSDMTGFQPHLDTAFDFAKRAADYLGYDEHPYDALLDDYEPGMTTAQVRTLFTELKQGTVPLLKAIVESGVEVDDSILHQPFDEKLQEEFGKEITQRFGYDWTRGRQDRTAHPFATSFHVDDVRITTRFYPDFLNAAMFGTMHEAGHAMYEQGVSKTLTRTPIGHGASLGVHESQSRMWENLVGRSRPFWNANYARLQELFPQQLGNVELETFYRAINKVQPSFIRVEADELTYNLHIMLRFELEVALLEGSLRTTELEEAWNAQMQELLGITPPTASDGVLQDTHWASSLIGYFPTYTIGNVLSVQLWEAALRDQPSIPDDIGRNEFGALLQWMREHVHQHGRKFLPNELIQRATGQPLTATPYLNYLHTKFGELYGVKV